jgi:hypothetical protein
LTCWDGRSRRWSTLAELASRVLSAWSPPRKTRSDWRVWVARAWQTRHILPTLCTVSLKPFAYNGVAQTGCGGRERLAPARIVIPRTLLNSSKPSPSESCWRWRDGNAAGRDQDIPLHDLDVSTCASASMTPISWDEAEEEIYEKMDLRWKRTREEWEDRSEIQWDGVDHGQGDDDVGDE